MEIEDMGDVSGFESMPKERQFYFTAVRYEGDGELWFAGPSGYEKDAVIDSLQNWSGISGARIYAVKLPVKSHPLT